MEQHPSSTPQQTLFTKNIHVQTSQYICQELSQIPQQLQSVSLAEMSRKVGWELQSMQVQACEDYVGVKEQIVQLGSELSVADGIMGELEQVLFTFKGDLETIKEDMSSLQQKSSRMATSLTNKKNVQQLLTSFVQSAVLDNQLKQAITSAPIDTNYSKYIRQLLKKFNYFNSNLITPDTKAIKQLQPQLQKLKIKASLRIRQFLLEQIGLLKKSKASIQTFQKNTLSKYNTFGQLLKEHNTQVYAEICNSYRQTMAKIYMDNYKIYLTEVQKLQIQLYLKPDHLLPYQSANMRSVLVTKHTSLAQDGKSIFYLMDRDLIISQHDAVDIIQYQPGQNSRRFTLQQTFKAANRCLINEVVHQMIFTAEFFSLRSSGAIEIFAPLFGPTIQYFLQFLKRSIGHTHDLYAVLLMLAINQKNKQAMREIGCNALDHYFSQVGIVLWPKFQHLFDYHLKSLQSCSVNHFKKLQKHFGQALIDRFVDYNVSLYRLYLHFQSLPIMFETRLQALHRVFFELINKVGAPNEKEGQNLAYCLNILQQVYSACTGDSKIANFKCFHPYQQQLQREIEVCCTKIINGFVKNFFPRLHSFLQQYYKQTDNEGPYIIQNVDQTVLQEIVTQMCPPSLTNRIHKILEQAEKQFEGYSLKLIKKNAISLFIRYYSDIYKYIKQGNNDLLAKMQPTHLIIKQLKNIP